MSSGGVNTEGLLPWEAIQLKTFLNWANSFIGTTDPELKILDPKTELADGIRLITLMENLTGEKLGRYHKKPKMKVHMVENLNLALKVVNEACEKKKIGLFYSAENMIEGNVKLFMGMLWVCISKFMIDFIKEDDKNARDALLLWCQKKTASYDNVTIESYRSDDFQNGMAFCALLHKHNPKSIDFGSLSPANKCDNLQLAMDVANECYGIPKLIDVSDIRESPETAYLDEKTLMTYLSFLWKQFASSKKVERVMGHVSKICRKERVNRQLMQGYETRAKKLLEWMKKQKDQYRNFAFGTSEEEVKACQQALFEFKKKEKPTKSAEKGDLETSLAYLQTKLLTEGRPPYNIPSGVSSQEISEKWADLCKRETSYEDEITRTMIMMRQANQVISGIMSHAAHYRVWIENLLTSEYFTNAKKCDSLSQADAACTQHELYEDSYEKYRLKLGMLQKNLENVTKYTRGITPTTMDEGKAQLADLESDFQKLRSSLASRKAALQADLLNQRALDAQRLEFAKRAEEFTSWVEDTKDELSTTITCGSVEEVNELVMLLEAKNEEISGKWFEIDALAALNDQSCGSEDSANPYTRFTVAELDSMLHEVLEIANNRGELLEAELKMQTGFDELRETYSSAASEYMEWAEEMKRKVATSDAETGTAEDELNLLNKLLEDLDISGREKVQTVDTKYDAITENGISLTAGRVDDAGNAIRIFSPAEISGEHELVGRIIREKSELIQEDIAAKNKSAVPEDVLAELEEAFKVFDKDNDDKLVESEFKACLQTLDMEFKEVTDANPGLADRLQEGISLQEFVDILGAIFKEQDTYEYSLECFKMLADGKDTITAADLNKSDLDPEDIDFLEELMSQLTEPNQKGARRRSLTGAPVLDYNQFLQEVYLGKASAAAQEEARLQAEADAEEQKRLDEEEAAREKEREEREERERKEREKAEAEERKAREEAEETARKAAEEARKAAEEAKRKAEEAKLAAEAEEKKRKEEEAARIAAEEERKRKEEEAKEKVRLAKEKAEAEERKRKELQAQKRKEGKQGMLYKKGGTKGSSVFSRANWNQRWFVVGEEGILRYFKDQDMKDMKGEIVLSECKAFRLGNHRERLNCVLFELKNGETFFMSADSETEAEDWLSVVKLYVEE
ncbi:hypothetical protein HOP50_18g82570 [Chloropicon primus]|uniref:Uncharacterized protein n=1 Tax=Chloropicon primus TaxID=1764295 RepID=A0A5B8N098_9CHLO|nr:hypothetical protein A3770_18p82340 [Chloropicon primus]UPR04912.1 hypothetical protein HOP50_18g82570 [Chloropicon primus]|eukprot:QDZ25716.1 hypothetical protein A3770_18p82340 [Chloropicon primus]